MNNEVISKKKRIALLLVYFVGYLFVFQLLIEQSVYTKFGATGLILSDGLVNTCMLLFFIYLLSDWLNKQWKLFKQRTQRSIHIVIYGFLAMLTVTIMFSFCVAGPLHLSEAENQVNNETMMGFNRIGFLFLSLIVAPFVEEIIFRGCIYHPAAKKSGMLAGAILSGLIFGILHIGASVSMGNWTNVLYIIDYGMCGVVLSYVFGKSDSIWAAIAAHALFNLLGVLTML